MFCVGLRGVLWEVFSVWFGLCIKFGFVVFIKVNGGPCNYSPRRDRTGHATIYWEHVEAKHCVFQHTGDLFLFWEVNEFHILGTLFFTILICVSICGMCLSDAVAMRVIH